ncbi:hypothetical protein [Pelagovum pacificum]|uniref:Cation/multidrug efflux pump n=1 Tax=Pelagovum pacificum TaxID=2588711 RepID=A0A5C5GBD5_9RHOB|nr:hypothetical protein [Pelagovum pacificum]QQA42196.1 hypothetical protein I8N54_15565 [Pelagovum pacificum]TNY31282.1 hypothetical protein FHY64_14750 [Pelagovum pacificum]
MQFVRLIVFGFIIMTIVYLCVSIYSRSVRREKLEDRWDADPQGDAAARDAYIEAGMAEYHGSLRKRLILLVYVVPTIAVGVIMYMIN